MITEVRFLLHSLTPFCLPAFVVCCGFPVPSFRETTQRRVRMLARSTTYVLGLVVALSLVACGQSKSQGKKGGGGSDKTASEDEEGTGSSPKKNKKSSNAEDENA